MRMLKHKTW